MNIEEIIAICDPLGTHGEKPARVGSLTHDSRSVTAGDVFIALRGTQYDGHDFIGSAVDNGASVVICEEPAAANSEAPFTVTVENTRDVIGPLAQAFHGYPARRLTTIGVTGTNGKTTVVSLVYQALERMGAHPSMLGTTGKKIGKTHTSSRLTTSDPIKLARDMRGMADAGASHLVMEVSSHALDQQRAGGIDFDVAVFTNLSHDHLDYHGSFEEYAEAKKRLFDGLDSEATAILNTDDEYTERMARNCEARVIRFGFTGESDIDCRIIHRGFDGTTITVERTEITSPLVGSFNAYNIAAAFLVCRALQHEDADISAALAGSPGAPGRLERVNPERNENHPLVLVDYAHSPDALENVLLALDELKDDRQKLHVIFGCGGNRDRSKRPLMARKAEAVADTVTVTSDNPRDEDPDAIISEIMEGFERPGQVTRITDRRKAIEDTVASAEPATLILIAGKGHETYQEVGGVRHEFDDREIARQALGKRNGNPKPEEVA